MLGTAFACGFERGQRFAVDIELVTCADRDWADGTMLLATHSTDKQLRLYRVGIEFQQLVFNIQHLKTISDCSPMDQEGNNSLMSRKMSCQISHLELIPPGPDIRNRGSASPVALAVFSYVPDNSQHDAIREEPFSILARWELHVAKAKLHPSFEQLTSKRPNVSSPGELPVRLTSSIVRYVLMPLPSWKILSRDSMTSQSIIFFFLCRTHT